MAVAMEPGPARSGMARGTTATSSLASLSWVSSGEERVREGWALQHVHGGHEQQDASGHLQGAHGDPEELEDEAPEEGEEGHEAEGDEGGPPRRAAGASPGCPLAVMATKIGSSPRGSMMKNTAGNVTREKLRYSFTR